MRDYLYIWHDPKSRFIVASGIQFKDFLPALQQQGGILLLDHHHKSNTAVVDVDSGFHLVPRSDLRELAGEDIHSWGDFSWVDYVAEAVPQLPSQDVAELLYFAHKAQPLHGGVFPSVGNKFLAYAHDDGWYLKFYYTNWAHVVILLNSLRCFTSARITDVKRGAMALWIHKDKVEMEEMTHDIDLVLNRRRIRKARRRTAKS